ncbi:MAG: tRNA (5-methylaminomethyl-2-thiouridine)(34)-methyltransferase MnmD [Bacteroidia bacterium]|nr:tRNA (5-methylaminomethyl-2-thiouridine)(34)-methyltransferase MnmD [Bacteroidia bacterium]
MGEVKLITTSDGSHSLFNAELGETYHSVHGAIQESMHVFVKNGLEYFQEKTKQAEINVLEIGFGTGLNALLTIQKSLSYPTLIHYESLEAFPIEEEISSKLNYPKILNFTASEKYFLQLHQSGWGEQIDITNTFSLLKRHTKLQDVDLEAEKYDVIFFDAFAPSKQPELWELAVLRKVEQSMKSGAVFVTYCARGQLKRDLKSLGLLVETLPGPPGKKEMVRAVKS